MALERLGRRSRLLSLAAVLALGTAFADVPLNAKPLAGLSYANSPYYGCSPEGRNLQWYRPGVPYPC
ncbi:MAG: hypothetical protein QM522_11740, partial [Chitinophagaceae bacterium]|nr:hypothetical protein [Chitinophagaceae bacterium]